MENGPREATSPDRKLRSATRLARPLQGPSTHQTSHSLPHPDPRQKPGPEGLFRTSPAAASVRGRVHHAGPGPRPPVPFPTLTVPEYGTPVSARDRSGSRRRPWPGVRPRSGTGRLPRASQPGPRLPPTPATRRRTWLSTGPRRPRRKPGRPFRWPAAGDEAKEEAEEIGSRGTAIRRRAHRRARHLATSLLPPFIRLLGFSESGRPGPALHAQ